MIIFSSFGGVVGLCFPATDRSNPAIGPAIPTGTDRSSSTLTPVILGLLALVLALGGIRPAQAQSGEVVKITQPAELYLEGSRTPLRLGDTVSVGDTILTGKGAEAQIIFSDETRIVVGPSSQLKIDKLLFRSDNTARKFAVTAAKGTFRFLSGNSPSKAYSVRTPIATMGVRGTAFDFAVPTRENTDLVVHDGEVRFCGRGGAGCANVPKGCQTVRLMGNRLTQPEVQSEREQILNQLFPYAVAQKTLRQDFQTAVGNCGGEGRETLRQIRLPKPAALKQQKEVVEKPKQEKAEPDPGPRG